MITRSEVWNPAASAVDLYGNEHPKIVAIAAVAVTLIIVKHTNLIIDG